MTVAWAVQVQHPGAVARTSTAQAGELGNIRVDKEVDSAQRLIVLGNIRVDKEVDSAQRLIVQHCVG